MALAPYPGLHATHRRAHHQPQVIDAQTFGEKAVLRLDHVGVAVLRKFRAQAVAGLGGLAVSDGVDQHDEVASRVEGLASTKQLARELWPQELRSAAAGAVTDDHCIAHDSLGVLLRCAQRAIVNPQLGERCAVRELEIAHDEVAFNRRWIFGGLRKLRAKQDSDDLRDDEDPSKRSSHGGSRGCHG